MKSTYYLKTFSLAAHIFSMTKSISSISRQYHSYQSSYTNTNNNSLTIRHFKRYLVHNIRFYETPDGTGPPFGPDEARSRTAGRRPQRYSNTAYWY